MLMKLDKNGSLYLKNFTVLEKELLKPLNILSILEKELAPWYKTSEEQNINLR